MRRNMELVREILIITADQDNPVEPDLYVTDKHSRELVDYHITIMRDAGLLNVQTKDYKSGLKVYVLGLTWEGQDFLAAVEDSTIWKRTLAAVTNGAGNTTLAVIKTTAESIAKVAIQKALDFSI